MTGILRPARGKATVRKERERTETRHETPPIALLGVPFDNVAMDETVRRIEEMVASRRPHYVVTANVDFLVQARRDLELQRILLNAPVRVEHDLSRVRHSVRALAPGENVSVDSIDNAIVLSGNVSTAGRAEKLQSLAAAIASETKGSVVNRMAGQMAADMGKSILGGRMGGTIGRAIVRGTLGGVLRR